MRSSTLKRSRTLGAAVALLLVAPPLVARADSFVPSGSGLSIPGWQPGFSSDGVGGTVFDATAWNDQLVIAGDFRAVGAVPTRNIATWTGSAWVPFGEGLDAPAAAVETFRGRLVALQRGSDGPNSLMTWNGDGWEPLSDASVYGAELLVASPTHLYVLGENLRTTNEDGSPLAQGPVAGWNGTSWEQIEPPIEERAGYRRAAFGAVATGQGLAFAWDFVPVYHDPEDIPYGVSPVVMELRSGRWVDWRNCAAVGDLVGAVNGYPAGLRFNLLDRSFSIFIFESSDSDPCHHSEIWIGPRYLSPNCLSEWNGNLIAGFSSNSSLGSVAQLVGESWRELPGSPDGSVKHLVPTTDRLYAIGSFDFLDDERASHVAQWDGDRWSGLDGGREDGIPGPVYAVETCPSGFIAWGDFRVAGGIRADGTARWTDSGWDAVPIPRSNSIKGNDRLQRVGDDVFVSSYGSSYEIHRIASDGTVSRIGKFDHQSVHLSEHRGALVVCGAFRRINGLPMRGVATWTSSTGWDAPAGGMVGSVQRAISTEMGLLLLGKGMRPDEQSPYRDAVILNEEEWHPFEPAPTFNVLDAVEHEGALVIVGQRWVETDGQPGRYVGAMAEWSGSEWRPLAENVDGPVRAVASTESGLFIGGAFSQIDGQPLSNIAKWTGGEWNPLGQGLDGDVTDLESSDFGLVVTGGFWFADGLPSAHVAIYKDARFSSPPSHSFGLPVPNPTRAGFVLPYHGDGVTFARCTIVDASGRSIREIFESAVDPSRNLLEWDGRDRHGRNVAAGIYYVITSSQAGSQTNRIVVVR